MTYIFKFVLSTMTCGITSNTYLFPGIEEYYITPCIYLGSLIQSEPLVCVSQTLRIESYIIVALATP